MTEQEIIDMAEKSGMTGLSLVDIGFLERFAELVAEREREACAQIVERNAAACDNNAMLRDVLMSNAAAIRARGEKGGAE